MFLGLVWFFLISCCSLSPNQRTEKQLIPGVKWEDTLETGGPPNRPPQRGPTLPFPGDLPHPHSLFLQHLSSMVGFLVKSSSPSVMTHAIPETPRKMKGAGLFYLSGSADCAVLCQNTKGVLRAGKNSPGYLVWKSKTRLD